MPKLESLYLAENKLISLTDLKELPSLKTLHLRKNELADLESFPDLPSLNYLNLRETKLENQDVVASLKHLKTLADLNLLGTPLEENVGDKLKKEVLILLEGLKLKRLNKDEVTEDDYQEAKELKEERIKEEEERRKEAELAKQEAEGDNE